MDSHDLEKLISQCKSSDVDAKIDAVTKLQKLFETGLSDADGLVNALKACLRTSNQHLTSATLAALPPFFPLITTGKLNDPDDSVDVHILRQILTAFLPSGGLLDRLGDRSERSREKARESMVVLGGLALRNSPSLLSLSASSKSRDAGKGPETPLMIWERCLREGGLQSKVWRVREQAILTLVDVRRVHPMLPLKPYLLPLVELLEDTDGTVRESARQAVVELFTGPTVTDAARADLKKEMTKKNVRKTIVDSVLQKLMSGGTRPASAAGSHGHSEAGSEPSEPPAKKGYIPPSLKLQGRQPTSSTTHSTLSGSGSKATSIADITSRPASRLGGDLPATPVAEPSDVAAVYVASVKDLEDEFTGMLKHFEGKETEHNWAGRERSIQRVRGMLKGEVHIRYFDTFLGCLKADFIDASFKTLASLRTTVAVNTCHLYSEMATSLGSAMDGFCEAILTRLISMASLTKKIVAIQSQQVADVVVTNTTPHPKMYLNLIWHAVQDKNISSRQYGINHLKVFLEIHGQRCKHIIETGGSQDVLEKIFKKALGDSNPGVRESARSTFWAFEGIWQERGSVLMASLDATAKKQLEKACPEAGRVTVPVTPQVKKSSVAAAIAASRAKAKAIANAPPSLRHQATSASHILQRSTSPTPRSLSLSQSTPSPKEGLYTIRRPSGTRPLSPLSPPARKSTSFSPTSSSSGYPVSPAVHNRTRSTEVPASPSAVHRRFASAQLSPPSSPSARDSSETTARAGLPPRNSLDGAFALPPSPTRQHRSRVPSSPTRIPSPTRLSHAGRRSDIRTSLFSFANSTQNMNGADQSLLLAQSIPLPQDSDSDDDSHMMSFSTPFEKYHISAPKTNTSSLSAGSPPASAPKPIVEDALRARAEQAESAAERLLELNEPDDETSISPIPPSLLRSNGDTPKASAPLKPRSLDLTPSTPTNKKTALLRQAASFKDSPANKKSSSLVDILRERKHETGWWLKRISLIDKGSPLKGSDQDTLFKELKQCISDLEDGMADASTLKKLALLCSDNPVHDDSLDMDRTMWSKERIFDRMFDALMKFLTPEKTEEELEYGLIALWEILESQAPLAEGREAEVFTHLLQIRFCNSINVLEATNTIRDALVARIDPVYGLTMLHASLRTFRAEPLVDTAKQEEKSASYAFGLIALGKFILRLPAEVLEDELSRLKTTLTTALSDTTSLVVRESAATCIIASQLVLRDETHLFTLLDGLPDEKKNLLTYLFDKHGARGNKEASGTERLEKEMRRLDGRTNTPPRPK
ncbi:uncharacterized protein FOMMEDRAFT_29840 [Fomitiporia mediterranea MF3/22]|uniref:uncharacterized protein n=1 Tax=Fomitiporia mediterranea (strain MF3/22) TaxID=694068 RepID=UPI0004407B3D|nr:uncharacterized protein FOMMEDRAFT_29840 [Fomitiporia mediterranea MF3/22]EJD01068.1 hypothetical protein FOMMEDRAFT_29840 [Fomitiporia mediterranea MF3/22]